MQKIGQGGYGVVFRNGNKAIKYQKNSNNAKAESNALNKLTNAKSKYTPRRVEKTTVIKATPKLARNIPRGVSEGNNVRKIVTEFINGGKPLKHWYTGSPIPKNIGNGIRKAIAHIHRHGIIHGNLHRDNILVVEKNGKHYVYIIDFGKSLVTNKKFNSVENANKYLKGLTGKFRGSFSGYGTKKFYYSDNKRTHYPNGNFLAGLRISNGGS
jgi:serine/threonine protein kinase